MESISETTYDNTAHPDAAQDESKFADISVKTEEAKGVLLLIREMRGHNIYNPNLFHFKRKEVQNRKAQKNKNKESNFAVEAMKEKEEDAKIYVEEMKNETFIYKNHMEKPMDKAETVKKN